VGYLDPSIKDDFVVKLHDDGKTCDLVAGDYVFSGCYNLSNSTNYGKWMVNYKSLKEGGELGQNWSYILYNSNNDSDTFVEAPKGDILEVRSDKKYYSIGESVKLYATDPSHKATEVDATLNNGTEFYVDLPFTIPIINVKRIHQPYWWFILISLITNLVISTITGRFRRANTA
jgi:hypothetical protein